MKKQLPSPPPLALKLLRRFCDPELVNEIEGDLLEMHQQRLEYMSSIKADLVFYLSVIQFFQPSFIRKNSAASYFNPNLMLQNHFKIAFRQMRKHKVFSAINIFGLALSMSVAMLIMLVYINQTRYDSHHAHKDRIYRVLTDDGNFPEYASTPLPLAQSLEDYQEIEQSLTLSGSYGGDAQYEDVSITLVGIYASSNLLTFFDFELKEGNPHTALTEPFSIVIDEASATKLFGNESALGKVINFKERGLDLMGLGLMTQNYKDYGQFTITGVIADTDKLTHIPTTSFASIATIEKLNQQGLTQVDFNNWEDYYASYTYVMLNEKSEEQQLKQILDEINERQYKDAEADLKDMQFNVQALTNITPGKLLNNMLSIRLPIEIYFFLLALSLVIIITACFNYTNLSIARSLSRAKEVCVRKVSGAEKGQLYLQFLSESVLVAFLAMVLSLLMLNLIKPAFSNLWFNSYLNLNLDESPSVYLAFALFALVVGIIAGLFPAVYTSKYSPVQVLRNLSSVRPGKLGLRKVLMVSQFSFSIIFILSTLLVFRQLEHFLKLEYGFKQEGIINLNLQGNEYQKAVAAFSGLEGVNQISASQYIISSGINFGTNIRPLEATDEEEDLNVNYIFTDQHYLQNLEIPLLAGRYFDENTHHQQVIINRITAEQLNFSSPEEAIGQFFRMSPDSKDSSDNKLAEVIGVVENFQHRLPFEKTKAMVIRYDPEMVSFLNLKISTSDMQRSLAEIESAWKTFDPLRDLQYEFFDEQLRSNLQFFWDIIAIIGYFAFLAIVISCLGLLGMATFAAETRIKEIGIRKVMGAEVKSLVYLLSRGFISLLLIAIMIATPLAYFLNNLWLQNFANRIPFSADLVIGTIGVVLLLGVLTVGSQAWRAARSNPIKSLRSE
ncbi:MAG: FtsX-like permease family protein [Cyclobacteriaceae bacterium]